MQKITRLRFGIGLTLALVMVLSVLLSFATVTLSNKDDIINAAAVNSKHGEVYDYATAGTNSDFVPNVGIGYFDTVKSGGFSGSINANAGIASEPIVKMTQGGTTELFHKNYSGNNKEQKVYFDEYDPAYPTIVQYRSYAGGNNTINWWRYIYSYLELPAELSTNGGIVNVKGNAYAYLESGASSAFFSLAAGDALNNTTKPMASSLHMNRSTGVTQVCAASGGTSFSKNNDINISINIRPGDKYVRISFIHLMDKAGAVLYDDFGSKLGHIKATYTLDSAVPTIDGEPTSVYDSVSNTATVTTTASDDVEVWKSTIKSDTMQETDMQYVSTSQKAKTFNGKVTENGTYTITAYDYSDKVASQKTVTVTGIDRDKPVIGEPIVAYETNHHSANVTFSVTDANIDASGITMVGKTQGNIVVSKVGATESTYEATVKANDTYTITANDKYGNTAAKVVEIKGIDADAPSLVVVADNSLAIGKKDLAFDVADASGIASVKYGESVLVKVSGDDKSARYSMIVTDNNTKQIIVTDIYGNTKTYDINAVNILTAGEGVDIEYTADDTVTVTKKLKAYNTMLGDPNTTKGTATKVYNFGIEAKYTITYDLSKGDVSETIDIPAPAKMLSVNVDGVQNSVAYGASFTLNADTSKGEFIGWFNERGGMVSDSKEYTISKVVTNMTFTAKYVTRNKILNVTFVNPNGNIIDIKSFADATELDRILDTTSVYPGVKAPEGVHMTFKCWRVISGKGTANVTVKAIYTTAQQFNVTVDGGVPTAYYYNQRVTLTDAPNGWGIVTANGIEKVTSKSMYTFYVLSDIELVRIQSEPTKDAMTATHTTTKVNGKDVISLNGFVNVDKAYAEVGFVFSNASEYLTADNFILENVDTMRISVANTKGGQFIVNVDATAFAKAKFRVYAIDTSGNVTYGEIMTLGGIA